MTTQDHLVSEVTRSAETVLPAMQIIAANDAIRTSLISALREQLESKVAALGWSIKEWKMPIWERYAGFDVAFTEECPFEFRMEFQNTNYNNLIFGIGKNKNRNDNEDISLAITAQMGPGTSNSEWLWYRYVSPQDQVFRNRWQLANQPRNVGQYRR